MATFQADARITPQGAFAAEPPRSVDVSVKCDCANPGESRKVDEASHRFFVLGQPNQFLSQSLFLLEHEQIDFPNAFHTVAKYSVLRKMTQARLPFVLGHE